ncbi:MAG: hypothetical protein ABI795_03460 [Chthoniobacterales bacterium]
MAPSLFRFWLALAAEIALCAALNFFDDWTRETMPVRFVATAMLCGIAYWFAVSHFPSLKSTGRQALAFWAVAIVLRLVVLPLEPGDDLWRYQWEGEIQHSGVNPYVTPPDAPELTDQASKFSTWAKINHRDFAAIYPPGTELMFRALSRISRQPLFYKVIFAAADLGAVALLLQILGGADRYRRAAWYAWNPLVVYSFAGSAHFDSVMICALLAGVLFLQRQESAQRSREKWLFALAAAAAIGLAISLKLVPVLLLLVCAFALGKRAVTLLLSLAIPGLLSVVYGWPKVAIWASLRRFAYVTRLNDLFWWFAEDFIWSNSRQKNYHYNVILAGVAIALSLLFFRNWKRGLLWVLGAALVLSPVLHPWYCTWILPFATWRGRYAWHVLSITLFAYFLFWDAQLFVLAWHADPWMRALIIVPPLVAASLFAWRERRLRVIGPP